MARFKAGLAGLVWLARCCCWCSSVPICFVCNVRAMCAMRLHVV